VKSGEAGGGADLGRCGTGSRGPQDSIRGLDWGRELPRGRGGRSKPVGAAGARALARGQRGQGNAQVWELN
jgi:hypothetical protein